MIIQVILVFFYLWLGFNITRSNTFLQKIVLLVVSLYGFQILLAILDPYQIYKISNKTVVLFNLQILFILFGVHAFIKKGYRNNFVFTPKVFKISINRTIIVVQTLLLYLSINRYQKMQSFLNSAGVLTNEARNYYYTELYSSYTEKLLNQIVNAYSIISYFFIFGLLLFYPQKLKLKHYYVIISGLAVVILDSLSSGGRAVIFQLIVIFMLFFFYGRSINKSDFRKKIIPLAIALLAIVSYFFVQITLLRTNNTDSDVVLNSIDLFIVQPFAMYLYGPVCAFDYGSQYIFNDLVPMFGAADFAGIIDFLITPFQFFDHSIQGINNILGAKMTPQFVFPSGITWNALFTGASNYYIDFGVFGFVIFPFVHGCLLAFICNKALKNGMWFVLLLWIFKFSYNQLSSSGIQSMSIVFTFFWIWYIHREKAFS